MVYLACVSGYAQVSRDDSLIKFRQTVRDLYNELSFSGVDFGVSRIKLLDCNYGLAFARFDKKNGQRQILFNHRYFYENIWKSKNPEERNIAKNQIRGLLAHEWAHHYMGHTFDRNTIQKESNADILAGRILFDNLVNMLEIDLPESLTAIETQALLVGKLYENKPTLDYHLGSEARKDLIRKGFYTSLVLKENTQSFLFKVAELSMKNSLRNRYKADFDTAVANIKFYTKLKNNIQVLINNMPDSSKVKTDLFKEYQAYLNLKPDTIYINPSNPSDSCRQKFNKIQIELDESNAFYVKDSLLSSGKCKEILEYTIKLLSIDFIVNYRKRIKENQEKKKILLQNDKDIINKLQMQYGIKNKNKILLDVFDNDKYLKNFKIPNRGRFDTESFYNLYYTHPDLFNKKPMIALRDIYLPLIDTVSRPQNMRYKLKGDIIISIDTLKATVNYNRSDGTIKLDKVKEPHRSQGLGFQYWFQVDESKYFIDKYHHLWIATFGARQIYNKLFLQHFQPHPSN